MKSKLIIEPPLLNSSCPWATTLEDLRALHNSPYTGAVTTRTSLLEGFAHDPSIHQHVFFTAGSSAQPASTSAHSTSTTDPASVNLNSDTNQSNLGTSSLNTYGYSPLTLSEYLDMITDLITEHHERQHQPPVPTPTKPFIISVTGTPDELAMAYALIASLSESLSTTYPTTPSVLAMEINLSCPNIHGAPPPAYTESSLMSYLEAVRDSKATYRAAADGPSTTTTTTITSTNGTNRTPPPTTKGFIPPFIGLKLPPYTYHSQFEMVVSCLRTINGPPPSTYQVIDFLTSTNTLGSSLVLSHASCSSSFTPTLSSASGTGHGGLAGHAIHPLSLGNVSTFRALLDAHPETTATFVIGVGGVDDKGGYERMRSVGAAAVGVATGLGRGGVGVFEKIAEGEVRK